MRIVRHRSAFLRTDGCNFRSRLARRSSHVYYKHHGLPMMPSDPPKKVNTLSVYQWLLVTASIAVVCVQVVMLVVLK